MRFMSASGLFVTLCLGYGFSFEKTLGASSFFLIATGNCAFDIDLELDRPHSRLIIRVCA